MMRNMTKEYGPKKGKSVYYAMENKIAKQNPAKAAKMFNISPKRKSLKTK